MTRLEWNALQVGDRVLVHDMSGTGDYPLVAGRVTAVAGRPRWREVGVRVAEQDASGGVTLWPSRLRSHLDPMDRGDRCQWCQSLAGPSLAGAR